MALQYKGDITVQSVGQL